MPNILDKDAAEEFGAPKAIIGYGMPSAPAYSFDQPDVQEPPQESIFHPVKAVDDIIGAVNRLASEISLLVKDMQRERTPIDRTVQIGATIAYTADYLEHKYLYALASSALTLIPSTGGTLALTANKWTQISLPRGTQFTIQGGSDATPNVVIIRACDVYLG